MQKCAAILLRCMVFHLHGLRVFPAIGKSGVCRHREIARDKEGQRDIWTTTAAQAIATQRESMHADRRMRCFASFARLLRPGYAEHQAPKLRRKSKCTRRAWTKWTRAVPERALHEPSPERADARESTGARKRPEERLGIEETEPSLDHGKFPFVFQQTRANADCTASTQWNAATSLRHALPHAAHAAKKIVAEKRLRVEATAAYT